MRDDGCTMKACWRVSVVFFSPLGIIMLLVTPGSTVLFVKVSSRDARLLVCLRGARAVYDFSFIRYSGRRECGVCGDA